MGMNLLQEVLAALGGPFTQQQRLLKLHTPLGADVLLAERIDGIEAIGPSTQAPTGARFVVHALSTNAHLDLGQLIGQPALIELLTAASRSALRPWHGHITHAALEGSDGGLARYRLVIEPWLAFLAQRQDSWAFQDKSVREIVDEVFADYQGQGKLAPAWRWALADESVYARRSLCIQYQESDLAFVQRLLREEGLFCWFEHEGAAEDASLGRHTLVIADHNGAFGESAPPVRYTQSGASLAEDGLVRWSRGRRVQAARIELASPDYRSGPHGTALRPVSQTGNGTNGAPIAELAVADVPGQYAYEDSTQGERLVRRQMEALDAQRERAQARGPWRLGRPGGMFTLVDHSIHDGRDDDRDRFVALSVRHVARNNLRADVKAGLDSLLGAIRREAQGRSTALPNESDEPLYEARIEAQRAAVPVRMAPEAGHGPGETGLPDIRLTPRPTIHGVQTALVVGNEAPVHTERDHRIKIQFHWQRGARSSHRLAHATDQDNAPAGDASGTWVRVAEQAAGANWGSNFIPRVGQEVLVGFMGGDIDRPIVLGALYNGVGQADAQGNQAAGGAAGATGNAPAWFPGDQPEGKLQGHQHAAVLSGHKSQELQTSTGGAGGHNQLVLDDSPGQGRIELSSTSAQTRLQLGQLRQQSDNRLLQARGHGWDLTTQAWGALRAGSGLLISAHGKPASTGAAMQMDTREPRNQLEQSAELVHTLAESAQQHQAKLPGEPDTIGARQPDARKLPIEQALNATAKSLAATERHGESGSGTSDQIGGGAGTIATLGRPDLVIAAPGGIAAHTPAGTVASAGHTASVVAGQDLQLLAQGLSATAVIKGLVFYTYGKAQNAQKPNQETGIRLHAASGSVSVQSLSAATHLTADKKIDVASTQASVKVSAPQHILLTAAGAAIRIEGGNITLSGPGKVEFKAGMKELTGPQSASPSLELKKPAELKGCSKAMLAAAAQQSATVALS